MANNTLIPVMNSEYHQGNYTRHGVWKTTITVNDRIIAASSDGVLSVSQGAAIQQAANLGFRAVTSEDYYKHNTGGILK